jgi:cytochrome c biogenesis protein CcmG/thiol:disulfide interchange protein DsbE
MRLFILAAALLGSVLNGSVVSAAPVIDQPAPSLILTQLNGEVFDLSKMRGKVVLVNYWATWCAPCKKEMPILNAFYQRHRGDGLEVIGISADRPQDFAKMRKISNTLAYPAATLNQIADNGFGPPEGFPLTYVVDRNGVIRDKFIDVREQLLTDVVLPLLAH